MTSEEAITWLKELTWHEGEDVPIYDTDVEAIKMGIKALEQKQRWIPVTERLPEEGTFVLASYKSDEGEDVIMTYYNKYEFIPRLMTAWMTLPEPYKAEEEE